MTTVTWTGKSGTAYEFEIYELGQIFNPVSGVYIFCRPLGLMAYTALYVGEAQSLYDRLNAGRSNHDGLKRAAGAGATHVAVMRTYDESYRLSVETDLRHGLDPECNRQGIPSLFGLK
jgi:hypothetical protein